MSNKVLCYSVGGLHQAQDQPLAMQQCRHHLHLHLLTCTHSSHSCAKAVHMLASSCSVCAAPASASCTSCWKPVLCLCSRPYSCRICCSGSLCLCLSVSGPRAPMSTCSWNSGLMSCKACRCQSPRPDASAFWAARSRSCQGRWELQDEYHQNACRDSQLM